MKEITIPIRRFYIILGDGIEKEADAYHSLQDKATGEYVGIAWFVQYDDHNEMGMAKDIPYMVIDREYPKSLEDFLSMVLEDQVRPVNPDPRDAQ
jgi:hypothetical protein